MNKYIEHEFQKLSIPYEQVNENTFIFSKQDKLSIQIGHYYIVQFAYYIIHPYERFDLHQRFNNGVVPRCEFMEIELLESFGKMYKIQGVGYDWEQRSEILSEFWEGCVPQKSIKFLKEVY